MQIFINDHAVNCNEGQTLSEILTDNGIIPEHIAIAVDNTIVPKQQWVTTVIRDGSRILIIKAVQGG